MKSGRKPYKLESLSEKDMYVFASMYAFKGIQLAYKCTSFDLQTILLIGQNYGASAISISLLTGYAKGRIYQRLNKSIERGFIEQSSKCPNRYRLTSKGSFAYSHFTANLNERLSLITKLASDQETENRMRSSSAE